MAFSRSETEDRRQWPSAPPPSHSTPLHPAPPPRAPHVIHNNPNSTITSLMSSGEEGHPGGTEEEGKRHQEVAASLSPNLFPTPRLLLVQAGTPLPEMHSSASLWVEALATRQSVKTLTDCVDEYQMYFFFFFPFWWFLYYFVCVETLGSVTCYICCGRWRNWPVSSWLKQREI